MGNNPLSEKDKLIAIANNGGGEVPFGSNRSLFIGEGEEDDVFFKSHDCEQFYYKNLSDFMKHYLDDDESVSYGYSYYLGERNLETGVVTYEDGTTKTEEEMEDLIDKGEDGGVAWSKIEQKGEKIAC